MSILGQSINAVVYTYIHTYIYIYISTSLCLGWTRRPARHFYFTRPFAPIYFCPKKRHFVFSRFSGIKMPRCVVSQAPKPPKVGRGVNTTKASNTAKAPKVNKVNKITKITKVSKKVSKDNGKGKGCKSARAKKLPSTARPPREHARQTFPLSNVRGCPHAEDDAEHADAATIAPAPRPDPPATPPGSRRSNIASKIKRLRMAPDHLLQFPQVNHRYLSAQGRILFDNRYEVHLSPPADSPKRLPRHTKAAPKATHAVAQAGSVGVRSPTLDQKVLTQEAGALRV